MIIIICWPGYWIIEDSVPSCIVIQNSRRRPNGFSFYHALHVQKLATTCCKTLSLSFLLSLQALVFETNKPTTWSGYDSVLRSCKYRSWSKEFTSFRNTKFITVFTRARHRSVFRARLIHSSPHTPPPPHFLFL
jgi:hypothetical protein